MAEAYLAAQSFKIISATLLRMGSYKARQKGNPKGNQIFQREKGGCERRNSMSKDFNEAVDVLFHKVDDLVSTKTVVGDAIVVGDMTPLPLIDVAVGAGVGAKESANAAGGMGARITPSAILMIRPDGVQLINVKNQDALSKLVDMAPGVVNKLNFGAVFSGRNKKERAQEEVKFEEETIIEE